jgi:hypothetical protein
MLTATIANLVDPTLLDREDAMHEQFDPGPLDHATSGTRSSGSQLKTPQRATDDLPGVAQVFSAVFAILLAAMVGATLSGLVVAALTAIAAGCACATIYAATSRRPWTQGQESGAGRLGDEFSRAGWDRCRSRHEWKPESDFRYSCVRLGGQLSAVVTADRNTAVRTVNQRATTTRTHRDQDELPAHPLVEPTDRRC